MGVRIAILPARGGSKRLKSKNIRPFCGKPMIQYALAAAAESGLFDKIHVSTDSEEIRRVVEGLGVKVDFLRTPELADDHTPLMPVLQWVLREYSRGGQDFADVCQLMPCAPLVMPQDLQAGYEIYERHGRSKPLVAVAQYPVPVEWAFERDAEGRLTPCRPGMYLVRSQDLKPKYYDAGAFIFYNAAHVLSDAPPRDGDYVSHVLPKDRAVDIDDEEDWLTAEALCLARSLARPRPEGPHGT